MALVIPTGMTAAGMSSAIQSELSGGSGFSIPGWDNANFVKFCDRVAAAVVGYIHSNGKVTVEGVQSGGSQAFGIVE